MLVVWCSIEHPNLSLHALEQCCVLLSLAQCILTNLHKLFVQNYTDEAMPETEEAPADEVPVKPEDKDDDKDKDEDEE